MRKIHSRLEVAGVSHQRCGSDAAGLMALDDGAIHAASKAEIVSVDDETTHESSLHQHLRAAALSWSYIAPNKNRGPKPAVHPEEDAT
jgi:hypothetical protein